MNKKADASMWWIIIGAVIALVVLIVLMVIFTGKTGKLEGGLLDCESKGGVCLPDDNTCQLQEGSVSPAFDCSASKTNPQGICCFKGKKAVTG
ncbi:hypothetical protein HZC32_01855 [Candidatus Woesearchaeota archaeon]|nr:hypothetical protein [Candidatus Woesearchaeota archaeon]